MPSFTLVAQGSFFNFESKQTSPIRLSPNGTRLFAVNTPDHRLSVFDLTAGPQPILTAEIPVGLEPVSVNPRTDDEIWVVNEVSDSISIVSLAQGQVVATLSVKDEPADVVFAQGRAFVTASRRNEVRVFDAVTRAEVGVIPLQGENPRAITVNAAGTRIYVAFALSGNRTTVVPFNRAPAPPAPTNPALPPAPQVGLIVDAADPTWAPSVIKFTMPDNDVAEIDTSTLTVLRYFPSIGTVNLALTLHPNQNELVVANTEARNLVRFEPVLKGNLVENRISKIDLTLGVVTHVNLNPGVNFEMLPNLAAKSNALAQPTAAVFGPSGSSMLVAAFGSDRVAKLDANGNITARIEVGSTHGSAADPRRKRGPRGLALGRPGSQRLYVLNRISNTLSVIDLMNNKLLSEHPVGSHDPTPQVVREGRGFLYDAQLSGSGNASCATCHIDADMDMIAWDLGDPGGVLSSNDTRVVPALPFTTRSVHPMKGPMTTQTLRGLKGQDPLHWRGDRTNFTHFNGAFESLLGGELLTAEDMLLYRAYIDTILFQPNPNQNLDRTYPTNFRGANAEAGRNTFFNEFYQPVLRLACTTCHTGPPGSGSDFVVIDRAALEETQDFKVPHLRNVYQKLNLTHAPGAASVSGVGIIHDGTDPDLFTFLSRSVFGTFASDTVRKRNLEAFVQCFDTGTAPAVGYTRTLQAPLTTAMNNDWALLEAQAAAGNIDLVVKGKLEGVRSGLLYQPATGTYRLDQIGTPALTKTELQDQVASGDILSLLGVPPGSGQRLALDRDLDGVLDGDTEMPSLTISRANTTLTISWPALATGFILEQTTSFTAPTWIPVRFTSVVNEESFVVTVNVSTDNIFFRLREL